MKSYDKQHLELLEEAMKHRDSCLVCNRHSQRFNYNLNSHNLLRHLEAKHHYHLRKWWQLWRV